MTTLGAPLAVAGQAFDRVAESYDQEFTNSRIGRLQRQIVWDALGEAFAAGDCVLELNCGTGEDAVFLAKRGVSVLGCDASPRMVEIARQKMTQECAGAQTRFEVRPNERLGSLEVTRQFDGALSNFSGLNCVADLGQVAMHLGRLVKPGGRALLGMSTRVCLWEMLWFLGHGNPRKAFRRLSGRSVAHIGEIPLPVLYPSKRTVRKAFSPWFGLRKVTAVGLFIPPSYVEEWSSRHRRTLAGLERMDRFFRTFPGLAHLGDHVLFEFERAGQ